MPSRIRKKREKNKDYYEKRKNSAKAAIGLQLGVPVSQNPQTNTDDENPGINFTNFSITFSFLDEGGRQENLVAKSSGIQIIVSDASGKNNFHLC